MLDFEDARQRILRRARALPAEQVDLGEALGRVLARDVVATRPLPEADASAMDGYALCTSDLPARGPYQLEVVGESRAGAPEASLAPGRACRIFTGALLPQGADSVILQENVERTGDRIHFAERPTRGQNVRMTGSDLRAAEVALRAGTPIDAFCLGALAALDRASVDVTRAPRVSILCTGDELRPVGSAPVPGSIPESNGFALWAMVTRAGGRARRLSRVGDDKDATIRCIEDALTSSDLLLTVGGVSVGDHDVVRDALSAAGVTLDFWKVRIKPGKPLVFGHHPECLVLGLPGNPISAQVTFGLFGLPLLRKLQGARDLLPTLSTGRLAAPLRQNPGRLVFHRVRVEGDLVHPLTNQSSGSPLSLAHADALALVAADSSGCAAGEHVQLLHLDRM